MYILEGNIGVGKSTILQLVEIQCSHISVIQEPKDNWATQTTGQSLLGNFYQDPHRWAYTLETLAMIYRVKDHLREQKNTDLNRIMERSIYSGHYFFAMNDYASGYLSSLEWEIYLKWFDFLATKKCNPPLGFIYLHASPDICFKRIKKRNRAGEENVSFDYLIKINNWHENFFIKKEGLPEFLQSIPVLSLDCNEDFFEDPSCVQQHLIKIESFVEETQQLHYNRNLVEMSGLEPLTPCV
jgi:deoxyguanosine kinase